MGNDEFENENDKFDLFGNTKKVYNYLKPIESMDESIWEQDSEKERQKERLNIRKEILKNRKINWSNKNEKKEKTLNRR